MQKDSGKKSKKGFIKSLKDEVRRITWTSKEELKKSTKVVIGSTFFFGLAIYLVDLVIRNSLQGFNSVIHRLIG